MGATTLLASSLMVGCFEQKVPAPKPVDPPTPSPSYSPLNDTGITKCGNYAYDGGSDTHNNNVDCATAGSTQETAGIDANGDPVPASQDAVYGRDATHNDDSDGHAGFSFTKLDANGQAMADQAQDYATNPWTCVKDNVTGLIWEVKTDDGGLQDKDNTYTWYNSTGVNDGGLAGTANSGTCSGGTGCDTEKYVVDVNAINLCGASDWRLPTKAELSNIVSRDRTNPAIDSDYFPNANNSSYWSSSPLANNNNGAWSVNFFNGNVHHDSKYDPYYIRLVRASQQLDVER